MIFFTAPSYGRLSSPAVQGGRRSFFGFWIGGYCSPPSTPVPDDDLGGHFGEEEYRKYRKYLERLSGIKSAEDVGIDQIEAIENLSRIDSKLLEIPSIAKGHEIDIEAFNSEIERIYARIEDLYLDYLNQKIREQDDELAILLLM